MTILYVIEIFILTTIIYFCVTLLSVFLLNEQNILQENQILQSKIIIDSVDYFGNYIANCNTLPKKCPSGYNCDCSKLCRNKVANKIEIVNEKYGDFTFSGFENGIYCYIPTGSGCKAEFGSWVFDNDNRFWKCIPHYNGVFNTEGKQLVGTYPYAQDVGEIVANNNGNVNYNDPLTYSLKCSHLKDEYGKPLLTFKLESSGLSFCLKDYCVSGLTKESTSRYENGHCICDIGSRNLVHGDLTSQCIEKDNFDDGLAKNTYRFKIGCYSEDTFIKDLVNYLLPCTSTGGSHGNFLNSHEIQIATYDLKK